MPQTYYRAVSLEELADFRAVGRLRAGVNSCEGKHLACTLVDARRWGEALHGAGAFAVLRIVVQDAIAATWANWARLDGIGPARFATIEQLAGATVDEVSHGS
jgi:hypothetical protein